MSWEYLYKTDYVDGSLNSTNLLYAPLIKDNTICMDFEDKIYHRNPLSDTIREYFFEREVTNLQIFSKYNWCPKLLDIQGRKIFLEFGKETINSIVMNNDRNLNKECPDWKSQIRNIIYDIELAQYHKVTLYPHCFFIHDNIVKTMDFYGCIPIDDPMISLDLIREMIGKDSVDRFNEATIDDKIDFRIFYNKLLDHHLIKYWPELF